MDFDINAQLPLILSKLVLLNKLDNRIITNKELSLKGIFLIETQLNKLKQNIKKGNK